MDIISCLVRTLLAITLFASPPAWAGEVTGAKSMSFGNITLHPGGDTIIIEASDGPTTTASASRSHVEGGHSGYIDFTSVSTEHVTLGYPESITLTHGSSEITVSHIRDRSQYSSTGFNLPGGGGTVRVSIGGELHLDGSEDDAIYSGTMTVQIIFE